MAIKLYLDGANNFRVGLAGSTKDGVFPAGVCTLVPNADASRVTILGFNGALGEIDGDYAISEITNALGVPYADYDALVTAVGSFFRKPSSGGGGLGDMLKADYDPAGKNAQLATEAELDTLGIKRATTIVAARLLTGIADNLLYISATDTLYKFIAAGGAYVDDSKAILTTGTGGNTRWIGVSGRYILCLLGVANGILQVGTTDPFGRNQIWNALPNASLRLGSLGQDGDVLDASSEGSVFYGVDIVNGVMNSAVGDFGYARIKQNRFGLYNSTANVAGYYFRVDNSSLYLANNSFVKTFEVNRLTGNTYIGGLLRLMQVKSGATQVLAGAGVDEIWKTNGHATLPDNVLLIGV